MSLRSMVMFAVKGHIGAADVSRSHKHVGA